MDFDIPDLDDVRRIVADQTARLARRYGVNSSDCEDLEQDLVLEVIRRLPLFDPDRSSRQTFIARAVFWAFRDLHRRRQRRAMDEVRLDEHAPIFASDAEMQARALEEHAEALQHAIEQLDPEQRHLCALLAAHSPSQVAEILGVTRSTVSIRIERTRAMLQEKGFCAFL